MNSNFRHLEAADTDWTERENADFKSTGRKIIVGDRLGGRLTYVYIPSAAAQEWDGVIASHALGSRWGGYGYANIKVSGRIDRYFPGFDVPLRKLQITTGIGTSDESTCEGWLIGGGTID